MMRNPWFSTPLLNAARDLIHQVAVYIGDYWGDKVFVFDANHQVKERSPVEFELPLFKRLRIGAAPKLISSILALCEQMFDEESQILSAAKCADSQTRSFLTLIRFCLDLAQEANESLGKDSIHERKLLFIRMRVLYELLSLLAVALRDITGVKEPHPFDNIVETTVLPNSVLFSDWLTSRSLASILEKVLAFSI